jgi:3-oxoadipate enol-lactonase
MDRGHGAPLVLVPGIQGRSEWIRPAVDALAASARVLTLHLCGERGAGQRQGRDYGIDDEAGRIARLLDERRIDRAAIGGISFGGLIALRFAARHPDRTAALILASTPGPGFRLSRRHQLYVKAPRLFGPLFVAQSPWRVGAEILAALPTWSGRSRFVLFQAGCLIRAPLSPSRMARRAVLIGRYDCAADARMVSAPTLVVTGEPALDYVVSAAGTSKYVELIAGARHVVLDRTGHLGSITRPHDFAAAVQEFLAQEAVGRDVRVQGRAS